MAHTSYARGRYFTGQADVIVSPRVKQTGHLPVIYCHGSSTGALAVKGSHGFGLAKTIANLADLGFVVYAFDTDANPLTTPNWGNDAEGMPRMDDAYTYTAAAGKVHLLGASMGAVVAVRWAYFNPEKVASIAAMIPAYDMQAHRVENETIRATIDAAWGVTYPAALPALANPTELVGDLDGLVPVKTWYASDDISSFVAAGQDLAEALSGTAVSLGAVGHTDAAMGSVAARDIAEFFAAAE